MTSRKPSCIQNHNNGLFNNSCFDGFVKGFVTFGLSDVTHELSIILIEIINVKGTFILLNFSFSSTTLCFVCSFKAEKMTETKTIGPFELILNWLLLYGIWWRIIRVYHKVRYFYENYMHNNMVAFLCNILLL